MYFEHASIQSALDQLFETLNQVDPEGGDWQIGTAESCTGGLVAAALTDRAGSSTWIDGGVVSYSNEAKMSWLEVPEATLNAHGAVSEPVVRAMVSGVCQHRGLNLAVAISGIAGPGGGTETKPVGTVWLAWGNTGNQTTRCYHFHGDRQTVRLQALEAALLGLTQWIQHASQQPSSTENP